MASTSHYTFDTAAIPPVSLAPPPREHASKLRIEAREAARHWKACVEQSSPILTAKWKAAHRSIVEACHAPLSTASRCSQSQAALELMADHSALLCQAASETKATALQAMGDLPHVIQREQHLPRIYAAAGDFLESVHCDVQSKDLLVFFAAVQEGFFFQDAELAALRPSLQLILLERIGAIAEELVFASGGPAESVDALKGLLRSLGELTKFDWKSVLETLSETDHILRHDPAGAYPRMDVETRDRYHRAVSELAERSSWTEVEIAREAVRLASGEHDVADPRAGERRSHVGYYLIDRGKEIIKERAGYRATLMHRLRAALRRWPTFFYLATITLISCGILMAVAAGASIPGSSLSRIAVIVLIALIPVTECAIAITNLLVTHLLKPERLPRLEFSGGIPDECSTLVAIPILITSEKQVRQAVKDLEIRYLGNRDRHLHFALVTDLPDSLHPFDKADVQVGLCSFLIERLNEKYARRGSGSFLHLHRHRVYNSTEKIWMGWERKRGKMLDLNALLLGEADRFPVKTGNLAVLSRIRYVITLDQDTQIPTDSARRLVGALAHPLHRAVVDPATNRVVEGYAILQPRVAVSVKSARRSRLAAIFSGDATFDIYTRSVSDVYQDLFGAGIFTGKGIYEVAIFQKLLENRFPCNTILSHDLIEGVHARAGFISDIELVDDYPSHVRAYTQRKHRWVRGDWQIMLWLFPRVPESFGKSVPNPLSVISRWQILDNLRRSLSEVSTFALLLCGWMLWPKQAFFWTMTALVLTASPICLDTFVSVLSAGRNLFALSFWKNVTADFAAKWSLLLCRVALLCYQSLIAIDAVVRTTVRMTVTRRRLLQWETAAQAEVRRWRATNDAMEMYLTWTLPASILMAGLIARFFPSSILIALPFLILWGTSKTFCDWLSAPCPAVGVQIRAEEQSALRHMALRTWRFFSEFCTEDENWLIPDVVQAEPPIVFHAASTTNLGFLLNAQLAARDLGFLTLSSFVQMTERTLGTISKLPVHNGHFYNWYDTKTLQPRKPRFISTVDNGNFVCCLWTLKGACAQLKNEPLFPDALRLGISAQLDAIESGLSPKLRNESINECIRDLRDSLDLQNPFQREWLEGLPKIAAKAGALERGLASCEPNSEPAWWANALSSQVRDVQEMVVHFVPWLSHEFADLQGFGDILCGLPEVEDLTPQTILPVLIDFHARLMAMLNGADIEERDRPLAVCFSEVLSRALEDAQAMLSRLTSLGALADRLADAQDFSMFFDGALKLLSIGYDVEEQRLCGCQYDLLGSEARAAYFVAIAKGDIPQQAWFRAGRPTALINGKIGMLSWTGTMFEYLLPAIWIKLFPKTLLEQAAQTAVLSQRNFAKERMIPWGFSECSCADKGPTGRYEYRAVGVPDLALSRINPKELVVSPYSAFLALMIDGPAAFNNLREMQNRGWLGAYGFCDAYDFTADRLQPGNSCEIVACWMAHHQGMIMMAAANALYSNIMQRRFHAEPMVMATERLLQEASRRAPEPLAQSGRLDWLKPPIPVWRNFWQSAFAARREKFARPSGHSVHETSG